MRINNSPLILFFLLTVSSLLVACGGGFVDTEGSGFVDTTSAGGFDRESVPVTKPQQGSDEPVVMNESHEDFVPPPVPDNEDDEPLPYEESFAGRGAVDVRVWNDRGFEKLFLPDGAVITLERLGIELEVVMIASSADGDAVVFAINGEQIPSMRAREQVRAGRTYVLVRNVYAR